MFYKKYVIAYQFFLESPSVKIAWLLANGCEFVRDVLVAKHENVWSPFKGQATTMSHLLSIVKICGVCLTKYSKTIINFLTHNMTFLGTWSELWECSSKQCINHTWVLLYNFVQCGMGTRTKANVPLFEGMRARTRHSLVWGHMGTRARAGIPLLDFGNNIWRTMVTHQNQLFIFLRTLWRETSRSHHISKGWRSHKHTPWEHLEIHYFKSQNHFSKDELWWYFGKQYFNCIAPDAVTVCGGWLCHFLDHIIWRNLPGDDHMLVNSDQNLCSRWIFSFKCCICHLATGHNSCFVFNSLCKINTPSTYEPPTAQPASQYHCLPAACGIQNAYTHCSNTMKTRMKY
jgi:hypothetical protein